MKKSIKLVLITCFCMVTIISSIRTLAICNKGFYRNILITTMNPDREPQTVCKRISEYEINQPLPEAADIENKQKKEKKNNTLNAEQVQKYEDGSIIQYGQNYSFEEIGSNQGWIALLDKTGKTLWKVILDNGFESEDICAVFLENKIITVISRGDLDYLCVSKYDMQGKYLTCQKNDIGNYGLWNAAKVMNGYIVQTGSFFPGEYARIMHLDSMGNIVDTVSYTSEGADLFFADIIEFEGKVYFSGYMVPRTDATSGGSRGDIANVLDYVFDNERFDIQSEELTMLVRDNYTAFLLACDANTNEPVDFFTIKGSVGAELQIEEEQLKWHVQSITDTYLSMLTSSFTIGGSSCVYEYVFDQNGTFSEQTKTEEFASFRR